MKPVGSISVRRASARAPAKRTPAKRTKRRLPSLSLLAALVLPPPLTLLPASVATADTSFERADALQETKKAAVADVIVLFASNSGTGIDGCAAHLKALKQPPLSAYDSYSCLAAEKLPLLLKKLTTMTTPDEGKLSLSLNAVVPRENKKPKYDIDVQIDKADGAKFVSTNVKAPQGKYFFLAGQKHTAKDVDGVLVFAIRLQAP